jgi:hypothetical protein
MNKALLLTAALVLVPLPALSQGGSRSDDREYGDRRDDIERALRDIAEEARGGGGGGGGGPRRGASFLFRSGDATIAVRCDGKESMRACVDATLALLDKARTATPPSAPTPPR